MKSYRRAIALMPSFFLCYCMFAFLGAGFASKHEIFPVFNWSLFSEVREVRELCEVEVLSINDMPLKLPTRFYELPGEFSAARNRDATVMKLTQRVCRATIAGDEKTFAKLRNVLESSFLSDQQTVTYRLVWQYYNPIDRWRDGSVISSVVLGEYRAWRSRT